MSTAAGTAAAVSLDDSATVLEHLPLCRQVAAAWIAKLPAGHVSIDDLYQEANMAAVQAVRSYKADSGRSLKSWVQGKANWAIQDYLRSLDTVSHRWGWDKEERESRRVKFVFDIYELLPSSWESPEEEAGRRMMERRVWEFVGNAVGKRGSKCRRAFLLHYKGGLGREEVARLVGAELNAIHMMLWTGRKMARKKMEAVGKGRLEDWL